MKKKIITKAERQKIWGFYREFRKNPILLKLCNTPQHRTSNTFRHVNLVTKACIEKAIKKNMDIDYHSLIRGAFLHDLFYYDWRKDHSKAKSHLKSHPITAIKNARNVFHLNDIEIDIIANHMWPITITHFPKTKEGKLVMMMDKKVTIKEFFNRKKETLIFDLDGTLLDTLPSLNKSLNYALKQHKLPLQTLEETRLKIGNGIAITIRKSIPEGSSEETYLKVLNTFRQHYSDNCIKDTKEFPDMLDTLKKLRANGYRMAVVTNKDHVLANKLISKFYPKLFAEVIGYNGVYHRKPHYDMVNVVRNNLKIKKRKSIVYIGDTEIDFLTAKNAMIEPYLVTYGYRTMDEFKQKKIRTHFIDEPSDLLTYFNK